MRIVEQTRDRLTLKHKWAEAWWISAGLTLFASLMLLSSLANATSTRLQCQRLQTKNVLCHIEQTTAFIFKDFDTLKDVKSAEVKTFGARRRGRYHRLVLTTPSQTVVIPNSEQDLDSIDQILDFLHNPQLASLRAEYRTFHSWIIMMLIAIGSFGIAGLIFLRSLGSVSISYQSRQSLVIDTRTPLGMEKTQILVHTIDQIGVDEVTGKDGSVYFVAFRLKDGKTIYLPETGSETRKAQEVIVNAIQALLL